MHETDKPGASDDRLHIRIPPDVKKAARAAATEDGRSMSNFVIQCVREVLRRRRLLEA